MTGIEQNIKMLIDLKEKDYGAYDNVARTIVAEYQCAERRKVFDKQKEDEVKQDEQDNKNAHY